MSCEPPHLYAFALETLFPQSHVAICDASHPGYGQGLRPICRGTGHQTAVLVLSCRRLTCRKVILNPIFDRKLSVTKGKLAEVIGAGVVKGLSQKRDKSVFFGFECVDIVRGRSLYSDTRRRRRLDGAMTRLRSSSRISVTKLPIVIGSFDASMALWLARGWGSRHAPGLFDK